jgi:hypothetical protein
MCVICYEPLQYVTDSSISFNIYEVTYKDRSYSPDLKSAPHFPRLLTGFSLGSIQTLIPNSSTSPLESLREHAFFVPREGREVDLFVKLVLVTLNRIQPFPFGHFKVFLMHTRIAFV